MVVNNQSLVHLPPFKAREKRIDKASQKPIIHRQFFCEYKNINAKNSLIADNNLARVFVAIGRRKLSHISNVNSYTLSSVGLPSVA
ncbi:hypothetical protein ACU5P1_16730 [Pseudomonas plecoglossicida]|uniref:hypothetical protein n=1 Tax=Pseudomonas plecoglossicida TaxID=70775 RepID=UPI0011820259|nr:hypothetical protein [Pseudomonas plecoglossicida]QLB56314.1 hypothetical protein HAV28_16555 [Pseudomonas plecoglossicida]